MQTLLPAIRVKGYLSYMHWSPVDLNDGVPFVEEAKCEGDGSTLAVVATLVGRSGAQRIRIGCCPSCGYVGYIDRIKKEWFLNYYRDRWDATGEEGSDIEGEIAKRNRGFSDLDRRKSEKALRLAKISGADSSRSFCEIGVGYGFTLKEIRGAGFKKVIGIEPSSHRAEIARRAYGLEVIHGSFGEAPVFQALSASKPIGTFYSSHVLEHVYHPGEVIEEAARFQEDGGRLIISVPNFTGEPTHIALFQLIHQHIFTPESLRQLYEKNGYEVSPESVISAQEISMIGIRRKNPKISAIGTGIDYPSRTVQKFAEGLELVRKPQPGLKAKIYHAVTKQSTLYRTKSLGRLHWEFQTKALRRKKKPMAIVRSFTSKRYTNSPVEVQFDGNIKLLYQ